MNKKIKELAQQAEMASNMGDQVDVEVMMEKFAELIVKEVIAVYNHDGFQTPSEQDYLVLKHFGVK